jgi:hypothetical protein
MAALVGCVSDSTGPVTGSDMGIVNRDMGTVSCSGAENNAAACGDQCDNDGDEYTDCDDRDCCDFVSCPATTYCGRTGTDMGTPMTCEEGASTTEDTLEACTDSCDNDENGYVDCQDRNCCDVAGVSCGPTTYCGRQSGAENTATLCGDNMDNDGDGFIDCNDFGCCALVTCGTGTSCFGRDAGVPRDGGGSRDAAMACTTTGPENTVEACSDSCDNEGDRFADCNDFDCCGLVTCGAGTSCFGRDAGTPRDGGATACTVSGPENTVEACTDSCSNDGDSYADCNDFDCCGVVTCGAGTSCFGRDAGVRDGG